MGCFLKEVACGKASPSSPQVRDTDAKGQRSRNVKEMKVSVKTPSRRVAEQEEQIKIPVSNMLFSREGPEFYMYIHMSYFHEQNPKRGLVFEMHEDLIPSTHG